MLICYFKLFIRMLMQSFIQAVTVMGKENLIIQQNYRLILLFLNIYKTSFNDVFYVRPSEKMLYLGKSTAHGIFIGWALFLETK